MTLEQIIKPKSELWYYVLVGVFNEFQTNLSTEDWSPHIIHELDPKVNMLTIESDLMSIKFEFRQKSGMVAVPVEGFEYFYISNYTKPLFIR